MCFLFSGNSNVHNTVVDSSSQLWKDLQRQLEYYFSPWAFLTVCSQICTMYHFVWFCLIGVDQKCDHCSWQSLIVKYRTCFDFHQYCLHIICTSRYTFLNCRELTAACNNQNGPKYLLRSFYTMMIFHVCIWTKTFMQLWLWYYWNCYRIYGSSLVMKAEPVDWHNFDTIFFLVTWSIEMLKMLTL